jgi:hypothetical protein
MTPQATDADPDDAGMARALRAGRDLESPPPAVLQRAMDLWRPRGAAAVADAAGRLLRRLTGVLRHDSGALPPLALGLRAGQGGTRQLLFSAGGHDVDLRVRPEAGAQPPRWCIAGQLLGPVSLGRVALRCGDWSAETAWNALCEFRFDGVPPGDCRLVLLGDDWEMTLGPVDLPAAPPGAQDGR